MALTVLIVEDEQSASRLLSAIAAEVGLSARATGSAREAREMCAQAAASGKPFSAVVLDLVLAEQDGFQFATAARSSPWGENLPLIIVSGIYKQLPPEFAARIKPEAFFAKPFEPAALRAALSRHTGAAGAQPAQERPLSEKAVAAIFVQLLRERATGVLSIAHETVRRAITFQQGMVRFAQSNVRTESVGAPQIASGLIKQTSFDRAVALAKQQNIPLHEALASARVMTPEQLKVGLRQQTSDVCIGALGVVQGTYKFEQKPVAAVNSVPDMRTSPVALVVEAARRLGNPSAARPWLEAHAQEHVSRSPELEREVFALKTFWPGEAVTPQAGPGRTVGEALGRIKAPELPLFQWLCMSGLLLLSGSPSAAAAKAESHSAATDAEEDRGKVFSPEAQAARRMLFGERDHLKGASHYEVLGIAQGAPVEEIKRAYFDAAKRFHSDSFSGLDLGSARRAAEELFAKVNEAYSVLSDKDRRADHDVYLDRKAKGLPTDVGLILKAEGLFQKGEALFRAGRWDEAEAQFRDAIGLNHTEAEFHAYLGMAIFRRSGKPEDGIQPAEKALEMDPRLHSATLFLAQMYEAQGDVERAKTQLRKAIEKDPDFAKAKDELRRLRNRPGGQAKGGFLSRLLKK